MRAFAVWMAVAAGCTPVGSVSTTDAAGSAEISAPAAQLDAQADEAPDAASAPPPDDAGLDPSAPVTEILPEPLIAALIGCWRLGDQERWFIRRTSPGHAEVVRELGPGADADHARRARIPAALRLDPKENVFGFRSAGRIHALLILFKQSQDRLAGSTYSCRSPDSGCHWTGNQIELVRCVDAPAGADHPHGLVVGEDAPQRRAELNRLRPGVPAPHPRWWSC